MATSTSSATNSCVLLTERCARQRSMLAMLKATRQASASVMCSSGKRMPKPK
jgi:hypothetical protein